MWFILSRSLLLGGGVLFWFGEFFSTEDVVPSKLRWVHMCPSFSYRKGLSATATFVAVLRLLWWLVLRQGNEQRVFNRINQDECEQQLLVQYWV